MEEAIVAYYSFTEASLSEYELLHTGAQFIDASETTVRICLLDKLSELTVPLATKLS